jgi:hypothetical protein
MALAENVCELFLTQVSLLGAELSANDEIRPQMAQKASVAAHAGQEPSQKWAEFVVYGGRKWGIPCKPS